jgi:c-di-GMP-binding flagellar brake protein YcgR
MTMSNTRKEKRRHERHDYPLEIEYVLEHQQDSEVVHRGVTVDISSAGLGAYLLDPLPVGERVIIKSGLPVVHQLAMICWIVERSASFYCAGMKFI